MAIAFNKANPDYYSSAGGITLPNADWCIAMGVRMTNNTGTERRHIFTCQPTAKDIRVFIRAHDLSHSSAPGKAIAQLKDGTNTEIMLTTANQLTVGQWILGVLQRTGTTKQLWVGSFGSVPTLQASSTATLGAVSPSAPIDFGWESVSGYYLAADIAFFAKGNFALTSDQMYALGRGVPPLQVSQRWDLFLPMLAPAATISSTVGGRSWTRTGSPAMVSSPFRVV